jgi:hypothetical protein
MGLAKQAPIETYAYWSQLVSLLWKALVFVSERCHKGLQPVALWNVVGRP